MAHAEKCYPEECCGLIVGGKYLPCTNIAPTIYDQNGIIKQDKTTNFEIDPEDLVSAENQGEIQAYVHSHPDGTTRATDLDRIQIEIHKSHGSFAPIRIWIFKFMNLVVIVLHWSEETIFTIIRIVMHWFVIL